MTDFRPYRMGVQDLRAVHVTYADPMGELPPSSEGLVVVDGSALVIIDGDGDPAAPPCAVPARWEMRELGEP